MSRASWRQVGREVGRAARCSGCAMSSGAGAVDRLELGGGQVRDLATRPCTAGPRRCHRTWSRCSPSRRRSGRRRRSRSASGRRRPGSQIDDEALDRVVLLERGGVAVDRPPAERPGGVAVGPRRRPDAAVELVEGGEAPVRRRRRLHREQLGVALVGDPALDVDERADRLAGARPRVAGVDERRRRWRRAAAGPTTSADGDGAHARARRRRRAAAVTVPRRWLVSQPLPSSWSMLRWST